MRTSARCATLIALVLALSGCYATRITKDPAAAAYAPIKWQDVTVFPSADRIPPGYEVLGTIRLKGEVKLLTADFIAGALQHKAATLGANGVTIQSSKYPGTAGYIISEFVPVIAMEITALAVRYKKDTPQ